MGTANAWAGRAAGCTASVALEIAAPGRSLQFRDGLARSSMSGLGKE